MATKRKQPKPAVRTRAATAEKTRAALVKAALALFAERGFDAPSLDDICERAGYTRGAFYVHFRDRDDLVRAAMADEGAKFLDGLLGALGAETDLGSVALRFVESLRRGTYPIAKKGALRPHQLLEACARSEAVRAQYVALVDESVARMARIARAAQESGLARGDVPAAHLGLLAVCAVIGAHTLLDLDVEVDVDGATASMLTLLSR